MTEAIVRFVLNKLADVITKEAQLLGGVEEQVKRVQRELIRIQCCLRDADSKRKGDVRVQNWLNELREIAYSIEDATDTFFLEFEDNRQKDPDFLKKFKQLCHKPMEVPVVHKLGTELEKIQKELEEIFKSRADYGIDRLQMQVDKGANGEAVILPFRRAAYHEVDETEIVGLQADKKNILNLLNCKDTSRRAVITVVGPGGLGKTTLAQMVYKSVMADFEYHIMLSVSQQFSLTDLLRKMLNKYIYSVEQDVGYYVDELRRLLCNKRYLIILDDVWGIDLWNQLKHALPDVKNRSRVLMTSRFIDVARFADPKTEPYRLDFLNDKDSLNLLLEKALHVPDQLDNCHPDFLRVAGSLSKRCMGLPLALIVVGGILSTKDQTYCAWERVLRTMDWHFEGKDCMKVLAMSYEDMPNYLKSCFLYLASFPKDYEIPANYLLKMWIAEGFITTHQGRKTMEEIAEDYLEELFQRSMVQVSKRYANGSIKYCRLHDLLRDLATHEAREENFVSIFSEARYINNRMVISRRASFQSCNAEFAEHIRRNTRSLLWFGRQIPKYSEFRLLRVLDIVGDFRDTEIMRIDGLINLKYLGIKNSSKLIKHPLLMLPGSLGRLKNLETLVLKGFNTKSKSLWTISSLRHVQFGHFSRINGPDSRFEELKNLQTLKWVQAPVSWERELPCVNNLRKLGLENPSDCLWSAVTSLLTALKSLVSIGIKGCSLPMDIVYPRSLPNYQNLQSLYLYGKWSDDVVLEAAWFPPHLVELTLIGSLLKQDPMPELGKLKSLVKLRLRRVLYSGSQMVSPAGFPALQYLEVSDCQIGLKVANGAMPKLKYFRTPFWGCNLEMPPDQLRCLTNINQ